MPSNANANCWSCRLITGIGMIGIGAYVFSQSRRPHGMERAALRVMAAVAGCLGIARLAGIDALRGTKGDRV